jgi:hypothetical protein
MGVQIAKTDTFNKQIGVNMNIPAFPRPASEAHQHGMHKPQEGMTLRDYFAAKAMQAYLPDAMEHNATENELAWSAYKMADAMLKARGE